MPRFDRYLLSQLMVLFGFFSLVLVAVYWLNRAVRLFDQLIGDGQSAGVFLQITLLSLPYVIKLVLPISAFAATVYAVNRLMSESELVVAQASGLSPFRMARPVALFGLLISVLLLILAHVLVPISRERMTERQAEVSENVTARLLTEGRFLHPTKGVTFYIGEITSLGELRDIFLSDARDAARRTTYSAKRALLVPGDDGTPKLVMFEGLAQTLRLADQSLAVTHFENAVFDIGGIIGTKNARRTKIDELSTAALLAATPETIEATRKTRADLLSEGHSRFAQPFTALSSVLLGFSALMLGGFSRFGLWRQIAFAIGLLIAGHLLDNACTDLARSDERMWWAHYLSPLIGICGAMLLLWIASRPPMRRPRPPATEAPA
ncbi:LPS export ABC transporter permease LptF [Actibacterium sp. XHP0104]|uniref:LPS export ABC transporter permease LptF n=1 Tax=Actibacterium sp. XHP0104 TaxID=2984335 RepID=UPI0021E80819|nr:LPS export ABC transporter permease LptF [Actibacterium sp. XHP0104]MCV2880798.1 LPS export ABC transporter permease LptF [Actibacterium sp. XHP0104]